MSPWPVAVKSDNPRALIRYGLVGLALTVVLAWALYLVRNALLLIYISTLIGIGLSPLVSAIQRRGPRTWRLPRWAAILLIYLCMVGVIAGAGRLVLTPLVDQARALWAALPDMLHRGQQWLVERGLLSRELTVGEAVQQAPVGTDAVGTVFGAITAVLGGVFGLVTVLIVTFYLLLEADSIVTTFVRLFPPSERARVHAACREVATKVSAWLGGQLLLAAIIGSTAGLGLWLMGVPYFYVLALVAGIGEMIPVVGPLLAAIPAVLVALTVSPALALGVTVFYAVQQQFENHVLVPKLMERQVGVSALVVIIALLIGGSLLGVVGAILAVPTAAVLQVLFLELVPEEVTAD
ncbi:MAG TPA: AI-2E family transporter [Vicinamibacterales bacterium]